MTTTRESLRRAASSPFARLFVTSVTVAMSGWLVLAVGLRYPFTFGGLYRMFLYHLENPLPYVALVSAVFAALGSLWLRFARGRSKGYRLLSSFAIQVATIAIASVPGGLLWVLDDMRAGYFPPWPRMVSAFAWGARMGPQVALFLVLSAVPMNLVASIAGHWILLRLAREADERERAVTEAPGARDSG